MGYYEKFWQAHVTRNKIRIYNTQQKQLRNVGVRCECLRKGTPKDWKQHKSGFCDIY